MELGLGAGSDGQRWKHAGDYFYAEVPVSSEENDLLYNAKAEEDQRGAGVPLQFGREVVASVLDAPNLTRLMHLTWHTGRHVFLAKEKTKVADAFRQAFA